MKKCALEKLGNCEGPMTGEHYISHSLLREMRHDGKIFVQGTPWSIDDLKLVGQGSLTANILCKKHNSGLSYLDSEAVRFMKAIKYAQLQLQSRSQKSKTHTFDGDKLERWFLKVCFMMWASGNFAKDGKRIEGFPPDQWTSIMSGNDPFPDGWGLYVQPPTTSFATTENEFEVVTMQSPDELGIKAAQFKMARLPFTLIMGNPSGSWGGFRPSAIILRNQSAQHTLRLRWTEGASSEPVIYNRSE